MGCLQTQLDGSCWTRYHRTVLGILVGVLGFGAVLVVLLLQLAKSVERSERDLGYRRRGLLLIGALYVATTTLIIVQVATGKAPIETLVGLPVVLFVIWILVRAGRRREPPV